MKTAATSRHDRIYRAEDEDAEKEIGARVADAWGLTYKHYGKHSVFDGIFVHARLGRQYLFELKNRNMAADDYPDLKLSKAKVEALYQAARECRVPALLMFHAKHDGVVKWVDIARCVNLRVIHNDGCTVNARRASDVEDCVRIPMEWFAPLHEKPVEIR